MSQVDENDDTITFHFLSYDDQVQLTKEVSSHTDHGFIGTQESSKEAALKGLILELERAEAHIAKLKEKIREKTGAVKKLEEAKVIVATKKNDKKKRRKKNEECDFKADFVVVQSGNSITNFF
jgi:hypothetical protein